MSEAPLTGRRRIRDAGLHHPTPPCPTRSGVLGVLGFVLVVLGGCATGEHAADDVAAVPVSEYLLGAWACTMVSSDPDDPDQGTAQVTITQGTFDVDIPAAGVRVTGTWSLDDEVLTVSSELPGWRTEIVLRDVRPGSSAVRYTPERDAESGVVTVAQEPDRLRLTWEATPDTNDVDCTRD